jgi:ubiquinone/menaquinone biosynthesis C-methylase UbiE
MPSVEWNRQVWGHKHDWSREGDEWSGMARYCGQPYEDWKRALVETFIAPVPAGSRVLEIAPGHGRWTEYLLRDAARLVLVDINQSCLDSCRYRFAGDDRISYHLTDGCSLAFLPDASVDFAWSFDAFVHMDPEVVQGYLRELGRVLAPGGRAVIHHAGKPAWSLWLAPLTGRAGRPGRVLQRLASQHRLHDDGARSNVSRAMMVHWATRAGLRVRGQVQSWGDAGQHTVAKYRDAITLLEKDAARAPA